MIPANYPLTLYRGDSARLQFRLWSDAAKTVEIDITGATAAAQIKDRPNGIAVSSFTCSVTPPNLVDLVLPASEGETLPPSGVWDLQVTLANGDVWTPVAGTVKSSFDVTGPAP